MKRNTKFRQLMNRFLWYIYGVSSKVGINSCFWRELYEGYCWSGTGYHYPRYRTLWTSFKKDIK